MLICRFNNLFFFPFILYQLIQAENRVFLAFEKKWKQASVAIFKREEGKKKTLITKDQWWIYVGASPGQYLGLYFKNSY